MSSTSLRSQLTPCAQCAGFNIRRAGRILSQQYDDALRPVGLRGTQFSLMTMLEAHGGMTVGPLAEALGMDRTTLTRNLRLLEHSGLVTSSPGQDRRSRELQLTGPGRDKLATALPLWQAVQDRLVARLGDHRYDNLLAELAMLTS